MRRNRAFGLALIAANVTFVPRPCRHCPHFVVIVALALFVLIVAFRFFLITVTVFAILTYIVIVILASIFIYLCHQRRRRHCNSCRLRRRRRQHGRLRVGRWCCGNEFILDSLRESFCLVLFWSPIPHNQLRVSAQNRQS